MARLEAVPSLVWLTCGSNCCLLLGMPRFYFSTNVSQHLDAHRSHHALVSFGSFQPLDLKQFCLTKMTISSFVLYSLFGLDHLLRITCSILEEITYSHVYHIDLGPKRILSGISLNITLQLHNLTLTILLSL